MAILNTSAYYNQQFENLQTDFSDLYGMPSNQAPRDNGMGLNPKIDGNLNTSFFNPVDDNEINPIKNPYTNQKLVSNDAQMRAEQSMESFNQRLQSSNKENITASSTAPKQAIGQNVANNAGGVANFGSQVYQGFTTTAQSDKQADQRTASLAVSGATLGLSIGGPWGAAIGAVVGLGAGMLMKVPDRKKRLKKAYGEYQGKLFDEINDRKAIAEDFQKSQEVERLMDLKKAQMGLISLKY